jgi:hypothetical protein
VTLRDELLRTGQPGPEGARLLYRTVRLVAVAHHFPSPEGGHWWSDSAVEEVAHDFLGEQRRLRDVLVRSVDDRSFERLLDGAVHNFLRDLARRTDLGKLILRVKEILHDEPNFEAAAGHPDRWRLADGESEPSTAPPGALTSAIAGAQVETPNWSSERRDAPLADRPSFVRLMTCVLTAAAGSLTADDLAHALTSRLDHRRTALTTSLDVLEQVSEPAPAAANPATRTIVELHAADLFATLSDRERIVLADPEATVRDLARRLGLGKSQADTIRHRLFERLRRELADDRDAGQVISRLCEFCDHWLRGRTEVEGATSDD